MTLYQLFWCVKATNTYITSVAYSNFWVHEYRYFIAVLRIQDRSDPDFFGRIRMSETGFGY
jgi:hypothetical protein